MSWAGRRSKAIGKMAVRFWTEPVRAEPLAAFRILAGTCLFLNVALTFLPRVGDFAGVNGLCPLAAAEPWFDRLGRVCLLRGPQHVPGLELAFSDEFKSRWRNWGDRPDNVRTMTIVWLGSILAMTIGFTTRFSTLVAWALTISFHNRFVWVLNGGDVMSRLALFYLLISPAGKVWSIDALIRFRFRSRSDVISHGPALIPAWSVRLAQLQLATMYFCTGCYKLWAGGGQDWLDGTAAYWLLNDAALARWSYDSFPIPTWICALLSWGAVAFEVGFPLFILSRRTRPALLIGGVAMHLGIMLTIEVGWFSLACLSWYPLFLSGERLAAFVHADALHIARARSLEPNSPIKPIK